MRLHLVAFAAVLGVLSSTAPALAQSDGCSPTPLGDDAPVFFQRVSDACPAEGFMRAEDVPQYVVDHDGPVPADTYVLATSVTRDDGVSLLVVVRPWSFNNFVAALAVAKVALIERGLGDGHTWHWTNPPSDLGT